MASTARHSLPAGFHMDPRFGAVYASPPAGADDLTAIRGIGTQEAARLNHLGIYYIDQIALWTDAQVVAVADAVGVSAAAIFRDRWVEQARLLITPDPQPAAAAVAVPYRPKQDAPPAPGTRTIAVLVTALLIGCFIVTWLNRHSQPALTGVLAADITSLRVPADSRLLACYVSPGDEVFTGETLLTLEKSEHLEQIARQTRRVEELRRALKQAELQAELDLEWRQYELNQELSESQAQARLFGILQPLCAAGPQTTEAPHALRTVARPRSLPEHPAAPPRSLLFISGATGTSNLNGLKPIPPDERAPETATDDLSESEVSGPIAELLQMEVQRHAARLEQLEQMRRRLPEHVRLAAGVVALKTRYEQEAARLTEMESLSRETAVLCPGYGRISQVRYRPGDRMVYGEVMLRILHTDRRCVLVDVPSERAGELQPGTAVQVLFPGQDACTGTVTELPTADSTSTATAVTVRVESDEADWPDVPIGSRAHIRLP